MAPDPLVAPLYEREPDSVPGPFYVIKDLCVLCTLPPQTAPANITWDSEFQSSGSVGCPNHCRVERQPETADELDQMIEAACGSCVEAIRYCGTDSQILAKFRKAGLERLCDAGARSEV